MYCCTVCGLSFPTETEADSFAHDCEVPPLPPKDLRSRFDVRPLRRTLEYVVQEAQKHLAAGHNDHFVAVGRIAQAALTWQEIDERGNLEEAEKWLRRIPR